jgi:predicted nucleic acid-binding protein
MTDEETGSIVYVDANPFIYLIEGEQGMVSRVQPFFDLLSQKPGIAMTSELTLAEVLPRAKPEARNDYLDLIVRSGLVRLQPVTRDILVDTADYRRMNERTLSGGRSIMPKLPDAIHVVTAMRGACRIFFSADGGLKLPPAMLGVQPNDVGMSTLEREIS